MTTLGVVVRSSRDLFGKTADNAVWESQERGACKWTLKNACDFFEFLFIIVKPV